jgi:polysaccharide export outer membrane protein
MREVSTMTAVRHCYQREGTWAALAVLASALVVAACAERPSTALVSASDDIAPQEYLIGPGDTLQVFVWENPDLSTTVPVRPDGRISLPLLQDVEASQKSAAQLAADIKTGLSTYIREPIVTVIVTDFMGPYSQQIRVVGEAAEPKAIPYRTDKSVLDVMIAVGGLTQFAAGNRAVLVRKTEGRDQEIPVKLDDLLKDGDLAANVPVMPGDVLVVPQSWF